MRRRCGITLIRLVVVITVIAVLIDRRSASSSVSARGSSWYISVFDLVKTNPPGPEKGEAIDLRMVIGVLDSHVGVAGRHPPHGNLPSTDGEFVDACFLDGVFPYLKAPLSRSN